MFLMRCRLVESATLQNFDFDEAQFKDDKDE
jgi:hypothetical protein